MKLNLRIFGFVALSSLTWSLVGCGTENGAISRTGQDTELPIVDRRGTVIADGCALDGWQLAVLKAPSTRRVLKEVVLLCGTARDSGAVGPADASARTELGKLVTDLRGAGYRVVLGVSFTDETGQRYDGAAIAAHLADPKWVAAIQPAIAAFAALADGVEIDIQRVGSGARANVSAFFAGLSPLVRPAKSLGIFVPPSTTEPSDLPGGDAFDVGFLANLADRLRVMTLDYTEAGSGPVIDPGWAVDAVRLASKQAKGAAPVDIAIPLYGTDYSSYGTRPISYTEAMGFAYVAGAPVQRGPTLAPHVDWRDGMGTQHFTWFDDRVSTVAYLHAWDDTVLPPSVGVVYYGFGAEDPTLWDGIAKELP